MADVIPDGTVSVSEAATMLGMTTSEAYDLVWRKRLKTIEAPGGRRVVPLAAIEEWQTEHQASA
jgi:hypothetical protein